MRQESKLVRCLWGSGEALQLDKAGDTVPDPHVWGDVENAIAMVNAIRDALIQLSEDRSNSRRMQHDSHKS